MRKRLFKAGICLLLFCTAFLDGCTRQELEQGKEQGYGGRADVVEVENLCIENYFVKGKNVQTFDKVPQRVVVIGESETEALMAMGVQDHIVMAFKSNDRGQNMRMENAARFSEVPVRTRAYSNVEYVSSLRPDLIVAGQVNFTQIRMRDTDYWNRRGIKTFVPYNANTPSKHIHPETIEKEMQYIEGLGRIFHKEERAAEIVRETEDTIREIREKTANEMKPKVMFVEFWSSLVSYDRTKLAGDMAASIGADVPTTSAVINLEQLIKEDPDVLFVVCSHSDYGACRIRITENPALKQLKCVTNHRVYSIPLRYTYSSLVRTADGLRYMAQCMYPQEFPWVDDPH